MPTMRDPLPRDCEQIPIMETMRINVMTHFAIHLAYGAIPFLSIDRNTAKLYKEAIACLDDVMRTKSMWEAHRVRVAWVRCRVWLNVRHHGTLNQVWDAMPELSRACEEFLDAVNGLLGFQRTYWFFK